MALDIQDTSYAGEAASFFLLRNIEGMDTFEKSCINIKDGIKKKHTIDRLEVSNFIQDRQAVPVSAGTYTIDSRVLDPADYMTYIEFNPRDWETNWFAVELQAMLIDRQLPTTASNFMMLRLLQQLNRYSEYALWNSRLQYNAATGGTETQPAYLTALGGPMYYFDGLIEKAILATDTIVVPSPITLTSANIGSEFNRAYGFVPKGMLFKYGTMGLKFLISYADKLKYDDYLTTVNVFKNNDTTETSISRYKGYDVVALAGIPENTFFIVIANPDPQKGNAWVGLNSSEDRNYVKLSPLQNNAEIWFVKALNKVDVQWGFTDQLVMYTDLTA